MQSFLLLLLGLAVLGACIWFLHRTQRRRTVENADLTAPLEALGDSRLPDFAGAAPMPPSTGSADIATDITEAPGETGLAAASDPVVMADPTPPTPIAPGTSLPATDASPTANDNWLTQIRSLREGGELDAALALSRAQFPKTQAFQQAAIILRQQIREALEKFQPVDTLLLELYHTAALADLFRTSSSHKPHDPLAALAAVRAHAFQYTALGHLRLKLLNKSDVRALEQLWGAPPVHRHTEDLLGDDWLSWCRAP